MPVREVGQVKPAKLQHVFPPVTRENATGAVQMGPNLTWALGQVLGQKTSDKKYYPYNPAANDGTEVAKVIAVYGGKTDAASLVYLGVDVPLTGFCSEYEPTLEVYYAGWFKVAELVGLDADAISDFHARFPLGADNILIPA